MSFKIAMTGSGGFVGSLLSDNLAKEGHSVVPIIRPSTHLKFNQKVIRWNPEAGQVEKENLEGYDCIIHLSGASIAGGRWSDEYKKAILESRTKGTTFLSSTMAQLKKPPRVFLCASAVGYYGNEDFSQIKDETSLKGFGFLADVCDAWEKSTEAAKRVGMRVVSLRLGMVLGKNGGALAKMLPIFKLGLGGKLASGEQPMSWILAEEISSVALHIIHNDRMTGAVNVVSPQTVKNSEFTKVLASALHRPAIFPVPGFMLKLMFGEMAENLLLGGQHVKPQKLSDSGYVFKYPDLKIALQKILSK